MDETSLRDTFASNRAIQSVWPRKQVRYDLVQKFKPKTCFLENESERAFEAELSKIFDRNNFAPERTIQTIRPRKEVWGRFHKKIPSENVFFAMDKTSLRHTFAPNRVIQSLKPSKLVSCDLVQKFKPKNVFSGKMNSIGLLRQNWAKFSSRKILPPNAPYWQLGPEKRYGTGFIKKFHPKTCFFGLDETSLWDTFAPNRAIQSVWPSKLVSCDLVQKVKPKTRFPEKRIRQGF